MHYDGQGWQKIESGTDVPIRDIWGAWNPETGEQEILAVASNLALIPQARKILKITNKTVSFIPDENLPLDMNGVWFVPG